MTFLSRRRFSPRVSTWIFSAFFSLLVNGEVTQAAVQVEVRSGTIEHPGALLNWPAHHEWKWFSGGPEIGVLFSEVTLNMPAGMKISKIESTTGKLDKPKAGQAFAPGTLKVVLTATHNAVNLEPDSGPPIPILISILSTGPDVVSRDCEKYTLQMTLNSPAPASAAKKGVHAALTPPPPKVFFPVGLFCVRNKEGLAVTVTVPEDVEWKDTGLFEVQGKGERWKQYVIAPAVLSIGGEVGDLNLGYAGVNYTYGLRVNQKVAIEKIIKTYAPEKPPEKKSFLFDVGLGVGQGAVTTPFTNGSYIQPELFLGARTAQFWGFLDVGTDLHVAIPFTVSGSSMTYYEMLFSMSMHLMSGSSFNLLPRIYFVSMGGSYNAGIVNFQLNSIGLGLLITMKLSAQTDFTLGITEAGVVPGGPSSVMIPQLGIRFPFKSSQAMISLSMYNYKFGSSDKTSTESANYGQKILSFEYEL